MIDVAGALQRVVAGASSQAALDTAVVPVQGGKVGVQGTVLRTDARIQSFEFVAVIVGAVSEIGGASRVVVGKDGTVRSFVPPPDALTGKVALAEKQREDDRSRGR